MDANELDLYEALQVHPSADPEVVQAAYRKLAAKYHPDKNLDGDQSDSKMKTLNIAYEVLSDPARRREYDSARRAQRATPVSDSRPSPQPHARSPSEVSPAAASTAQDSSVGFPAVPGWVVWGGGIVSLFSLNTCNNAMADSLGISRWLMMFLGLAFLSAIWAIVIGIARTKAGGGHAD